MIAEVPAKSDNALMMTPRMNPTRHRRLLLLLATTWIAPGCEIAPAMPPPPGPFEVLAIHAPGENAVGVFINTAILVELRYPVAPASITPASVYLAEADANGMETGVTVDVARVVAAAAPRFVVLDPTARLRGSTRFVVRLTPAVTSSDGQALADYRHPLSTAGAGDDVFHPVVSGYSPTDDQTIGCTDPVVIRFAAGTPIDPRTIDAVSVALTTAAGAVAYQVEYLPTSLTLRPGPRWTAGAAHTLTLDGNRILNLWDHTLRAGPSADFDLRFSVAGQCAG